LEPVLDKNYNSTYTFLSLNRNARLHRKELIRALYRQNLNSHGLVSCMFSNQLENIEPNINDNYEIYNNHQNDNVNNFNNKLRNYYKDTFVEIVSETSFTEPAFNLTEKTLNSVYGCSFPIFISSAGTVRFLRAMGLDVFDDVVDHSYDDIEEPWTRLDKAISLNINLLTETERIKYLHKTNQQRFINNVDFVKTTMYDFYKNRTESITNELDL
jgi:hypothetical protein